MLHSHTRFTGKTPYKTGFRALKERWLIAASTARIPANAARLAILLAKHFNAATRACFPSIPTLAKALSLCERTIQRLLDAMVKAGLIHVIMGGGRITNTYEMLVETRQAAAGEIATPSTTANHCTDAPPSSTSSRIWAALDSPLWRELAPAYRAVMGHAPPLDKRGGWFFALEIAEAG